MVLGNEMLPAGTFHGAYAMTLRGVRRIVNPAPKIDDEMPYFPLKLKCSPPTERIRPIEYIARSLEVS